MLAARSPQSSLKEDDDGNSGSWRSDEVWGKFNINPAYVTDWIWNLRKVWAHPVPFFVVVMFLSSGSLVQYFIDWRMKLIGSTIH